MTPDPGDVPGGAPALRFTSGERAGTSLTIPDEYGTVGRREDNAVVLVDPRVSRVHARFEARAGRVFLEDLGSTAGTTVNGDVLDGPQALENGDVLSFGPISCEFVDGAAEVTNETMVLKVQEVSTGPQLSPRQQQVIELIAEGMTNREIGDELGITERTVKAYAAEVYTKLDVSNRAAAVAEAIQHGLLHPE